MSRPTVKGQAKTKSILAFITILGIAIILTFLYLGQNVHAIYYMAWAILFPLGYIGLRLYKKWRTSFIIKDIRKGWGKEVKKERNFNEISRILEYIKDEFEDQVIVDDQTWNDLNMDDIFAKIDRTVTAFGEQMLYNMLRTPFLEVAPLSKRGQIINLFQKNTTIREDVLLNLRRLSFADKGFLSYLLWDDVNVESREKWIYYT